MADDTTPDDDTTPTEAPAEPKAKKQLLPIIIAAVVAAAIGGGAATFLGGGGEPAEVAAEPTEEVVETPEPEPLADAPSEAAVPGDLVTSGPHTVNLQGGGFVRLSVGVLLEHHSEPAEGEEGEEGEKAAEEEGGHGGGGEEKEEGHGVPRELVEAADGVITHLRGLTVADFETDQNQLELKAAVAEVFAKAYHLDVVDVFLVDLVVSG